MRIDLGQEVIASDGEKLGTVDRLVLDNETHNLRKFVVHKGMFWGEDRIVDLDLVSEIDSEGNVHLSVPSDDEDTMPPFFEDTFRVADESEAERLGYGHLYASAPYAPIWFAPGGMGGAYRPGDQYEPGSDTFFDTPGPPDSGGLETRNNLPDDSFTIDAGTEVVGADGDKVGEVDELLIDEHGNTTGFTVKAGFIFTHEVRIPLDAVDHFSGEHVKLSITGEEAESRYGNS